MNCKIVQSVFVRVERNDVKIVIQCLYSCKNYTKTLLQFLQ